MSCSARKPIELPPGWNERADLEGQEFLDAIEGFSERDLVIVRRLLQQVRQISEQQGPDVAVAVIERAGL